MTGRNAHHADYSNYTSVSKADSLQHMIESYKALAAEETNAISNLSNASSLIWHAYKNLNVNVSWAGFYITDDKKGDELTLGPFQGKVACQRIKFNRGVCGKAAATRETIIVDDVDKFPDHIACDGATKSEIVVPIVKNGKAIAVIDIDCLEYNAFGREDGAYLERLASLIAETSAF